MACVSTPACAIFQICVPSAAVPICGIGRSPESLMISLGGSDVAERDVRLRQRRDHVAEGPELRVHAAVAHLEALEQELRLEVHRHASGSRRRA